MQITKTVPVTIRVDDCHPRRCHILCDYCLTDGDFCNRYNTMLRRTGDTFDRCPACIAEFGTGEKPAVVPWEESKVGDVVEINGKLCRAIVIGINTINRCSMCCMKDVLCADDLGNLLCETHPSGSHIYFTEVENSPK